MARSQPWLVAAEWFARHLINWQHDLPLRYAFFSAVPQPFAGLLAVALVYRRGLVRVDGSIEAMARLVLALLIAAGLGTAANVLFVLAAPYPLHDIGIAGFAVSAFLGDVTGLLVIAPLAIAIASIRWRRPSRAWRGSP